MRAFKIGPTTLVGMILAMIALLGASAALAVRGHEFKGSFGSEGEGAGQFSEPRGIAVDQESGDGYLADTVNNRVEKFGADIPRFPSVVWSS